MVQLSLSLYRTLLNLDPINTSSLSFRFIQDSKSERRNKKEIMALLALALAFLTAAAATFSVNYQVAAANFSVDYQLINNATGTAGGVRFDSDIGQDYTLSVLQNATAFIWTTFRQPPNDPKAVDHIVMFVDSYDGVAYTLGNEIHVGEGYIANFNGDVRTEIEGVLFHEMTHVWQWNGKGTANGGLIEGIADFVRLRAGLGPAHWVKPGEGDKWDQGYDVTARFLDYCDGIGGGTFVADLNDLMKDGYNDEFFKDLLGRTVDDLWTEYKAKYAQ